MSDVTIQRRFPLSIVLLLGLVLLLASAAGAAVMSARARVLNEEATFFSNHAATAIATEWSDRQLLQYISADERKKLTPADLQDLSQLPTILGRFERSLGAVGGLNAPYLRMLIGPLTATYSVKLIYLNGVADFHLTLVKHDGEWQIDFYHLDVQDLGSLGRGIL